MNLQVEILRKRIKRPYLSDKMVYTFKTLAVILKKLNTQLKIWGKYVAKVGDKFLPKTRPSEKTDLLEAEKV